MGYFFVGVIALVIVGLCITCFAGAGGGKSGGRGKLRSQRPTSVQEPAADEPTPDRSVTATEEQENAARRKTPPS